jgi:hypothetical protein
LGNRSGRSTTGWPRYATSFRSASIPEYQTTRSARGGFLRALALS